MHNLYYMLYSPGVHDVVTSCNCSNISYTNAYKWTTILENTFHELLIRKYRSADFYVSDLDVVQWLYSMRVI